MTVCIAAICQNDTNYDPRIVLSTDGKGSTPLGSKEHVFKNVLLTRGWRCLTAGSDDDLLALMPLLQANFRKLKAADETNIKPAIRSAIQMLKLERNDEYTLGRYGMNYKDFLSTGREKLPEDQFRADMFAISEIRPKIECVIAGFLHDGIPMLLHIDGSNNVNIREDFAVAGEGGYLAQTATTSPAT